MNGVLWPLVFAIVLVGVISVCAQTSPDQAVDARQLAEEATQAVAVEFPREPIVISGLSVHTTLNDSYVCGSVAFVDPAAGGMRPHPFAYDHHRVLIFADAAMSQSVNSRLLDLGCLRA